MLKLYKYGLFSSPQTISVIHLIKFYKAHCIKLLGDKRSSGNFQSQVNEIYARVAVLNKFNELGRPCTQAVP
jgi:hypothetical protein